MEKDLQNRLKALECDPLKLSAHIASGHPVGQPHPHFAKISAKWDRIVKNIYKGELDMQEFNDFWELTKSALTTSKPSPELQSKHIISLTEYLHAKRKAIDATISQTDTDNPDALSDAEIENIILGNTQIYDGDINDLN